MFSLLGTSCTGFSLISNSRQPLVSAHVTQQQHRTSRCPLTFRLSICASSAQSTISPSPISPSPSVHPDALRRRAQALAWQQKQQQERESVRQGTKWWEGSMPANMELVSSREQHESLINLARDSSKLLVCIYFTQDCYICRTLLPKLKQIAGMNPDVMFAELNGSEDGMRPLFDELGITRVPFVQMVKEHEVVVEFPTSLNGEKLAQLRFQISKHKRNNSSDSLSEMAPGAESEAGLQSPTPANC